MTGTPEPRRSDRGDGDPPTPWWARVLAAAAGAQVSALALAQQGLLEGLGNKLGPVSFRLLLAGLLVVTVTPPLLGWAIPRIRRATARPPEPVPTPPRVVVDPPRAPHNLPPVAGFIGRDGDLDAIVGVNARSRRQEGLLSRARVVIVAGDRGVGTSWCVWKAADESWKLGQLADGRVYVDLRAGPRPLTARDTMAAMARLADLGELPATTDDADTARELGRRLAGREILFVLDNVDTQEQVRPILGADCHLLVAGGPALRTLTAAAIHELRPMSQRDAVDLFSHAHPRRHGENLTEHTEAVRTIARHFAGQPKVLAELGGWGKRRRTPAADLGRALLRTLAAPPYAPMQMLESMDAACTHHVAYCSLGDPAKRLVRLLSMVDGFLTYDAIRALAGPTMARRVGPGLDELSAAGFLDQRGDDLRRVERGLHKLARLHLHHDESEGRRRRAYTRLVRHLAGRATEQAELLAAGVTVSPGDDAEADWFGLHRRLLHRVVAAPAALHGRGDVVVPPRRARRAWLELAQALGTWYERQARPGPWRLLCLSVREIAAGHHDLRDAEGWAHNGLGAIALQRGNWATAVDEFSAALHLRGHRGQSQALTNRGIAKLHLDQTREALDDLSDARRHRRGSDRVGRGITDLNLGEAWRRAGDPERARHHMVDAANVLEGVDDRAYAAVLGNVVLVYATLRHDQDAVRSWQEALRVYERLGDELGQAEVRLNAAAALLSFSPPRVDQAEEMLTWLAEFTEGRPGSPLLARTLLYSGDLKEVQGSVEDGRALWEDARAAADEADDPATVEAAKRRLAV